MASKQWIKFYESLKAIENSNLWNLNTFLKCRNHINVEFDGSLNFGAFILPCEWIHDCIIYELINVYILNSVEKEIEPNEI